MEILQNTLPDLFLIFKYAYRFIFEYYGWVLFLLGMVYMLWRTYLLEIQHQFVHSNKFLFYSIKVPKENTVSTLAVETIFAQLHTLHVAKTFAEKYIEGHIQLWYSLEIVSMGGKVSFIVRVPEKVKHAFEAAIYSHYPQAEIKEVADYLENFEYDPDDPNCPYDIFGTEWKLSDDQVIPIKTYKDFEHPVAEEKIIDPLQNFFEAMGKMEPHEFFGVQIIIQPLADEEWKPAGEKKVKELIGAEEEHEIKIKDLILAPVNKFAKFSYKEALFGHKSHEDPLLQKQRTNWLNMTEGEKERVTLIEKKIGKPGYRTKIRFLYIAPKDKFDRSKVSGVTGGWRPLASVMRNKLKPDTSNTYTAVDYIFSKPLEKPYLDWLLNYKKRWIFRGYKKRDIHIGIPMFILNTEELATLYHFPITTKSTTVPTSIVRTEGRKAQPPVDLPVVE